MPRRKPTTGRERVKAVPKAGETPVEAIARVQKMHPGAEVYDPPRNGKSQSRGSFSKSVLFDVDTVKIPLGIKSLATGRQYESYGWVDPYYINRVQLILLENDSPVTSGIHTGGTISAEENEIVNFVGDLGNQLYLRAASKGLSVTGWNSATFATNVSAYLDAWIGLYGGLRGVQAMLHMSGYNNWCNQCAEVIAAAKTSLDGRLARLAGYPYPPGLRQWCDKNCGVWLSDTGGCPPIWEVSTKGSATLDLSTVAVPGDLTTFFAEMDTQFTNLQTGNAADFANIIRLFGYLYGSPAPLSDGKELIHRGEQDYHMRLSRAWSAQNTTSGNNFTNPHAGTANEAYGQLIPVVVWGDARTVDDEYFTLFTNARYYNNNGGAVASTGVRGTFASSPLSGRGSPIVLYDGAQITSAGVIQDSESLAVAFAPVNMNSAQIFNLAEFPFAGSAMFNIATGSAANDIAIDRQGYNLYYVGIPDFVDNTMRLFQQIFYDAISGPRG